MRGKISYLKAFSVLLVGLIFTFCLPITAYAAGKPSVTTITPATNITGTSATVSGNVTSINNSTITERGVCYSTSSSTSALTTSGLHVVYTPESGTAGIFSVDLTELSAYKTYYYRAYAINEYGITYGAKKSFKTLRQYKITYTAGSNGTIVGTTPQTVDIGSSTEEVTATPNTGYHFVKWSDNKTNAVRSDNNVTANKTYTATFAINQYTVTYAAGTGGTIVGTASQTVNYGSSTTAVTATPNANYHFVKWTDNNSTNPVRYDTGVDETITYTATFAINQYTITYSAGTGGTILGTNPQTITYGGSTTAVTATPNVGYHFVKWSDNNSTNPVRSDTNITSTRNYTATFALNQYIITYSAETGGSIVGNTSQTVNYGGSTTSVTATADSNYHFLEWSDNHSTNPVRTDTNVTGPATYTAVFVPNYVTVEYLAGEGGWISGSSYQTISYGGDTAAVTAIPNWGYRFVEWSDNHSTNPVRSDIGITESTTYTAVFAYDLCTITYVADEGGYISGSNIQTVSTGGSTATITAIPNWGYRFVEWSDNHSTNPVRSDSNVTADAEYHAVFAYNMCTITYVAGEGGYITGSNIQNVTIGNSTSSVTAIANWGYHFVEWSDNHSTNPVRSDVGVTTATYTAIFSNATSQYTITFNSAGGSAVSPITQTDGTAITAPNDPIRVGYTFLGWSPAIPQTMPTTNMTITAQWQKNDGVLTITNVVNESSGTGTQSYLFKIERNYNSAIQTSYAVILGSDDLTLTQLAPGTYTITEMSTWSWRYSIFSSHSYSFVIDSNNLTHQVTFTNQCTIFNWLSDVTSLINKFLSA